MSYKAVTHVIFDLDGLLLGKKDYLRIYFVRYFKFNIVLRHDVRFEVRLYTEPEILNT